MAISRTGAILVGVSSLCHACGRIQFSFQINETKQNETEQAKTVKNATGNIFGIDAVKFASANYIIKRLNQTTISFIKNVEKKATKATQPHIPAGRGEAKNHS